MSISKYVCEKCKINFTSYQCMWKHNNKYHVSNICKDDNPGGNSGNNSTKSGKKVEYICNICKKKYASYHSLWRHTKIKHNTDNSTDSKISNNNSENSSEIKVKIYKCKKCLKAYDNKYTKYQHQKICKENIMTLDQRLVLLETALSESKELTAKKITNNSNNKINNGVINHITINKIGTEPLNSLTDKNITDIFSKEIESIFTFVELLNFNKELPENHNHCVTNLEGSYINVYNTDTMTVHKDRKKYFFDTLLCKSIDRMEILFTKNKNKFNLSKQKEIRSTIDTLGKLKDSYYNKKLFDEIIKNLNLIAYNNKNIILDTWSDKDGEETLEKDLENLNIEELLEERKKRMAPSNCIAINSDSEDLFNFKSINKNNIKASSDSE
jgi:hypothetical protein